MQTLTNQKSRTVFSWLLIGLNLYKRMWINQKRSDFWAPCCNDNSSNNNYSYKNNNNNNNNNDDDDDDGDKYV